MTQTIEGIRRLAMGAKEHISEGAATVGRAQLRKNSQITLPIQVRRALRIEEGDEVEFRVGAAGEVVLRGLAVVPAEQRWFWTKEWQTGEREVSGQIAHGELATHGDIDDFFTDLKG